MSDLRVAERLHPLAGGELIAPYRTLALRVISLAVRDLITPGRSSSDERDTARAFLSGSRMLTHWCRLADINPEVIRTQLREAIENSETAHALPEGHRHGMRQG